MHMTSVFLLNQAVKFFSIGVLAYACGKLVVHTNIKVNYTRKIMHFSLFLIPIYLDQVLFVYDKTLGLFIVSASVFFAVLFIYVRPVRERFELVEMTFKAFDRPEDRPNTLLWLTTQVFVGYLVIVPMIYLFAVYD
jgi:hypothetical protein